MHRDTDDAVGTDSKLAQPMRQLVGAVVEFAIRKSAIRKKNSDRIRTCRNLLFHKPVQQLWPAPFARGSRTGFKHPVTFLCIDQRQVGECALAVGRDT